MKAIFAGGALDLGDVETAPTIGIVDYSRRVTDDFGVTTVVERGFSRTLSVKLGVPFDGVDALQRGLANLRATPAQWLADDRFAWLSPTGFFKDFDIDLAVPPLSYCTLTVEGFAEAEALPDAGGDPALDGSVSTLRLLQPVDVTDAVLIASNVVEADAPEWSAATVYGPGARVQRGASHRVFESLIAGNTGHDPLAAATTQWLDVGPTGRWAMFDQALGTVTTADGSIAVTLAAGAIDAVALLDVVGATVRVQAPGYDVTTAIGGGTTTFLDLPGVAGQVMVTVAGVGAVSVGTLLVGHLVSLGVTEASPGAGITDYSRKDIDDFGTVTIVQRAWSKRMTAKALIRTDAVDLVANRIAAVRAKPSLWIGQAGLDSLTVYGFFKDFSIEVSETTSKLSLSIEGFSAAAKIEPLKVAWPDITDPTGTKPEDSATNGAPGNSNVGGTKNPDGSVSGGAPASTLIDAWAELTSTGDPTKWVAGAKALIDRSRQTQLDQLSAQLLGQIRKSRFDTLTHLDGIPVGARVRTEINERQEQGSALAQQIVETEAAITGPNGPIAAAVTQLTQALADSDHAQALALQALDAEITGPNGPIAAAVTQLTQAVADANSARAEAFEQLQAAITANGQEIDAAFTQLSEAVVTETDARVQADSDLKADIIGPDGPIAAAVSQLSLALSNQQSATAQMISDLSASITGPQGALTAAVTNLSQAIADEAGARTTQVTQLTSTVGGNTASIEVLFETINGDQAIAQIAVTVDANGVPTMTGLKINGQEHLIAIAADKFVVGNSQIFQVNTVTGIVSMNDVEVGKFKAGSIDSASLTASAVQQTIYQTTQSDIVIPYG